MGETNWEKDDLDRVKRDHQNKLDKYRKMKDWEYLVQEDEIDIEGDRILAEIQNYRLENDEARYGDSAVQF